MIRHHHLRRFVVIATALATILATMLTPASALAQESNPAPLTVAAADSAAGVAFAWSAATASEWTPAAATVLLPKEPYGGYALPMQLYTLIMDTDEPVTVVLDEVVAAPLVGGLTPAPRDLPPALDWEPDPNLVDAAPELPGAPVFVVRQGDLRGLPIAVIAVSPLYEEDGVVKVAESVRATVPGGKLFDDANAAALRKARAASLRATPVNVPVNGDALRAAHKLIVRQAGIQEVTFAEVGGVDNPSNLRLTFKGTEVAIEVLADRFRFYAPAPGDRWNDADVYWLTSVAGARLRMTTLPAASASSAGAAYTRGTWVANRIYDSVYAGPDGDHWFNADMRSDPSMTAQTAPTATVSAPSTLPLIASSGQFSVNVTVFVRPPATACIANQATYRVNVRLGAEEQPIVWNPAPGCNLQQNWSLPVTMTGSSQALQIKLMPSTHMLGLKLDSMNWQRPVTLDFGGKGADFWTDAGAWSYTWSNLPSDTPVGSQRIMLPLVARLPTNAALATTVVEVVAPGAQTVEPAAATAVRWKLYDVTNPLRPAIAAANDAGFNQAASATPRHYLLADQNNPVKPTVVAHQPTNFGDPQAADAFYIGPTQFADELEPLFALRNSQGYTPLFVDVAAINDVYGYGHVSADAIRSFLRHRTDWQNLNRQISVVLVGDGTYDPHGFGGVVNANLVTPYMADVDPFIREVPCEPCFAQLHGDNPVTGDNTTNNSIQVGFFSADVWLGRFPVRDEAELTTVVAKLINYETQGGMEDSWRKQHVFLADNYITELDANKNVKVDEAGDFAKISDTLARLLPNGTRPARIYYDPAPDRLVRKNSQGSPVPAPGRPGFYLTDPRSPVNQWHIPDADAAYNAVVETLSQGAGLVFYNGHSNHFQYARTYTGPEDRINYLMNTNTANFALGNADKPFIMLAMTCYTSLFARPTNSGVLDEILFRRADGGAIAVWGPAGLTVAHGHDKLQTGFMKRLWAGESMNTPLGALAEAGYDELLTVAPINLDATMTFLLTGDPLTKARVAVETFNYLPVVNK